MSDLRHIPRPVRDEFAALIEERNSARQEAAELRAEVDELRRQLAGATDSHGVRLDARDEET